MKKIFFTAILLIFPFFVLASDNSNEWSQNKDIYHTDIDFQSTIPIIINIPPITHKIMHGKMLWSWFQENTLTPLPLKIVLSRLSEEYLKAFELVLSNSNVANYLPDSLLLLKVLEDRVIFFDHENGTELHVNSWELKIDFLRLALYYAVQAKKSLPENLIILRRHADALKIKALKQCADPFELAAFDKGCKVSKYEEHFKKELAIYAAFERSIYERLLEKEELYKKLLNDLESHMTNGTILRSSSTHPFNGLMTEYGNLLEVWNRRYEALTTPKKKYPRPESLAKKSNSSEEIEFKQSIYNEIEMLTKQVFTLQTIKAHLEECGKSFSDKLNGVSSYNMDLKALGTAGVIKKVILFTENYRHLLYEIHFERFWRLVSLVGTLLHIKSDIPIPEDLDSILMNAPHLSIATFNRIIIDLNLVKGKAEEIELRVLKEASSLKIEPKSRSFALWPKRT